MTLFGVDLSDYDWGRGPVDVASMARDGISFLTHKATEGSSMRHAHYGEALNRARAASIPVLGAYHVVRSTSPVTAQVAWFLRYLDQATRWWRAHDGFFLQADVETWPYDQVAAATAQTSVGALQAAQPKRVVAYASRGQYGEDVGADCPLWNADYPTWRTDLQRCPPAPYRQSYVDSGGDGGRGWRSYSGQTPALWQYTDNATIGSQRGCDANAFRGSLDQLRA